MTEPRSQGPIIMKWMVVRQLILSPVMGVGFGFNVLIGASKPLCTEVQVYLLLHTASASYIDFIRCHSYTFFSPNIRHYVQIKWISKEVLYNF